MGGESPPKRQRGFEGKKKEVKRRTNKKGGGIEERRRKIRQKDKEIEELEKGKLSF